MLKIPIFTCKNFLSSKLIFCTCWLIIIILKFLSLSFISYTIFGKKTIRYRSYLVQTLSYFTQKRKRYHIELYIEVQGNILKLNF